jgi:hypothetical protein
MGKVQLSMLALMATLVAGGAQARPRDQVMIGAYRCAIVASTKVWLDCYYGAAAPQRDLLNLISVPKPQIDLAKSPPAGGAPQDQPVRDQVMTGAGHCMSLDDERRWLNCYYDAALPARTILGLSTGKTVAAAQIEAPQKYPPQHRKPPLLASLLGAKNTFIEAPMTSYNFDRQKRFTVTLANGQSWQQTGSERAYWSKPASHYVVTITGGAFGSYNLAIKGESGVFKVQPLP